MAEPTNKQQFQDLEYVFDRYYRENIAPVVKGQMDFLRKKQSEEYVRMLDNRPVAPGQSGMMHASMVAQEAHLVGEWNSKTSDDLLKMVDGKLGRNKNVQHDFAVMIDAWRLAAVKEMGEQRYAELSAKCPSKDLAREFVSNRFMQLELEQLAKAQKKLARRQERAIKEGRSIYKSKNYQKQRLKVAKLHRTIARRREDYLDIQSKHLVESQDYIFAENIKTTNLLKNHKLAKAIADVAWGMFLSKVSYKCDFYGRLFGKVPPKNTTQTCSNCGHVMKDSEHLELDTREWTCPECGTHHNRDENSAINIKNLGKTLYLPRLT